MTIPREIQLIKKGNDYSLISNPVLELEKYYSKSKKEKKLTAKQNIEIVSSGKLDLTKAVISFRLENLKNAVYNFTLSNAKGESVTFGINNSENFLFLDRSKSGKTDFSEKFASTVSKALLNKNQKTVDFKIVLDKTSIEIFYNNGEKVMTELFFTTETFTRFSASSNEDIEINNLIINQLNIN